ncbi:MAG TPA: flagellar basal body rod protein FlgB [Phycisphaerales bacterium]|nr:flagellar basal body rod protein FlgB [Phycisphaerales bacterium]
MIRELANADAMPVLEQMMRFTAQRQRVLAHNIANIDTPDFLPLDVSPQRFQDALRQAVEARRRAGGTGGLAQPRSREIRVGRDGSWTLRPGTSSGNILYHDRNNRDVEVMMKDLAENAMTFRVATDLYRQQNDTLRTAISQRV